MSETAATGQQRLTLWAQNPGYWQKLVTWLKENKELANLQQVYSDINFDYQKPPDITLSAKDLQYTTAAHNNFKALTERLVNIYAKQRLPKDNQHKLFTRLGVEIELTALHRQIRLHISETENETKKIGRKLTHCLGLEMDEKNRNGAQAWDNR